MPDGPTPPNWLARRPGVTGLALLGSVLGLAVLLPYLQYVLFGVVLAYILYPVQDRVEQYVGPTAGAIGVVGATVLVVLLPLLYVVLIAVQQSIALFTTIRRGEIDLRQGQKFLTFDGYGVDLVALAEANQDRIVAGLRQVTTGVFSFVGTLPSLFIGTTTMLFVLFALLRDGRRLIAWFKWVIPVEERLLDDLLEELDQLMWASVVGNVAVAAIQALLLGVGLAVAGVPAIVFLTVATFVLTLLPLVGSFGVWLPAAGYLVASGRPNAAVAICLYGLLVMFSDSYLRPAVIGQTKAYNSAIVIVGIVGGLVVFGAVGLFVGPVVLGGSKLTLDVFARERAGSPDEESLDPSLADESESDDDDDADAEPADEGATDAKPADDGSGSTDGADDDRPR
jgi:predicted PurR-regulated permease PerM